MAKHFELTEEFVREWNRIRDKVDGMRGPGVKNTPEAISFFGTNSQTNRPQQETKEYWRVKVKNGSGADGDATNPPAYVYDVYALDGTTLIEAGVAMIGQRPNGLTTKAVDDSYATATRDKDGNLKLWVVLEKPTDDTCA